MTNTKAAVANQRDYFLISFIGLAFALFSIPILKNINIASIHLSAGFIIGLVIFFVIFANIALWIAAFLGKFLPGIFQFAKFAAVGAFNSFLDWGVMNVLIAATGIATGVGFSTFKGTSFIIASISSFFWNKYWTFTSKEESNPSEVGKFITVTIIGFLLNIALASLIVFLFTPRHILSPARLANVAALSATLISLIWNFAGYKFIVFKK